MPAKPRPLKWRTVATLLPLVGMLFLFRTAYVNTPVRDRDILVGGMLAFVGMGVLLVVLDVADFVRASKQSETGARQPPPPLDAIWDAVHEDASGWDAAAPVALSFSGGGIDPPSSERAGSPYRQEEFFARLRAMPMEPARMGTAATAIENAAIAVGCSPVPSVWRVEAPGSVNAFVAAGATGFSIAVTQDMLDTFSADELMAVFANLLCRGEAAIDEVGPLLPSTLDDLFALAMRSYAASDRRTLIAMRDPGPLASALLKTQHYDRFVPGSTIHDALAAWTWPGPPPAELPSDPMGLISAAARDAFGGDLEVRPHAEVLRLAELEKVAAVRPGLQETPSQRPA